MPGRGCAKNPSKRFLLVALLVLNKWVSSEAPLDGASAVNQARASLVFIFENYRNIFGAARVFF
jgi:hypothetical protein